MANRVHVPAYLQFRTPLVQKRGLMRDWAILRSRGLAGAAIGEKRSAQPPAGGAYPSRSSSAVS
jgi:hypothetical protein